MQDGQGQETGTANGSPPVAEETSPVAEVPFDHPFLQNIPEEDRPVVAKHLKSWDANVQRRFAAIHSQYEPYKNLGDVEGIQRAQALYNAFQANPQAIYQRLHEAFGQQQQQQQQPGSTDQSLEEYQPIIQYLGQQLTPFQTQMQHQQQVLQALANVIISQNKGAQEQREDAELEQYMANLHTEFGDFDDQYVLTLMQGGIDPEAAVQTFKATVQQHVNKTKAPGAGAPVLNGQGPPPGQMRSVTDLSNKETRDLVASVLQRANEQG